jgi:tRNA pseudouridine38-40 synthase
MAPAALARALNGLLSLEVRVLEAAEVGPSFHPRRDAISKLYRYELDMGPIQRPARRRLAAHTGLALDRGAVREAAELFVGRHDFASLASSGSSVKTTVRTVSRSEVHFEPDRAVAQVTTLIYEVEADGFLRKMVRSLVGGLIAAGTGSVTPRQLSAALEARDRRAWPSPAPARGLTLVRVDYPAELE